MACAAVQPAANAEPGAIVGVRIAANGMAHSHRWRRASVMTGVHIAAVPAEAARPATCGRKCCEFVNCCLAATRQDHWPGSPLFRGGGGRVGCRRHPDPLPNPPPLRGRGGVRGSPPRSVARPIALVYKHSRLDLARMRRISPLSRPPRGCLWLILNPARGYFPRARRVSTVERAYQRLILGALARNHP